MIEKMMGGMLFMKYPSIASKHRLKQNISKIVESVVNIRVALNDKFSFFLKSIIFSVSDLI